MICCPCAWGTSRKDCKTQWVLTWLLPFPSAVHPAVSSRRRSSLTGWAKNFSFCCCVLKVCDVFLSTKLPLLVAVSLDSQAAAREVPKFDRAKRDVKAISLSRYNNCRGEINCQIMRRTRAQEMGTFNIYLCRTYPPNTFFILNISFCIFKCWFIIS